MSIYSDPANGFTSGNSASERPKIVTDEHLEYLDDLRESGVINMFGARPFVMEEFPHLSAGEASEIIGYWMASFGKDNR